MTDSQRNQEYLSLARELIEQIESGDEQGADSTIDSLTRIRETELFHELGALTRELHEALKSFRVDTRLSDLAASDIPDARERLNYVISMTEQSANRTLEAIESSLPLVDELGGRARYLREQWQRFRNRELCADQFRMLSRELEDFLVLADGHGASLQGALNDALLAQDYQDLTGQIIRRVISLVQEVEDGLVELVRISGSRMNEAPAVDAAKQHEDDLRGTGPAIPGQGGDVVSGQDEVDDLLSSLGF